MKHYYCEPNKCAEVLTRMRANSNQKILLFDGPPVNLYVLLFYDTTGMYHERPLSLYVDSI